MTDPATTVVECGSREDWLSKRRETVGASEAATVLGIVEAYGSPYELYLSKRGEIDVDDTVEGDRREWGLRLEPAICQAYQDHYGVQVMRPPPYTMEVSTRWPWMSCTPDAFVVGDHHLQIKCVDAFQKRQWDGEPPLHYQVQVQAEMAVLNREAAYLVVLFGGNTLQRFPVERNDDFIAAMVERCRVFMEGVKSGVPPEVDGSLATKRALALLHPDDNGEEVDLPDESAAWDSRLVLIKELITDLDSEKRLLENQFKAAIGAATFGVLPNGDTYTFKTQTRAEHVVKASKFRVLRRKG